MFLKSLLFARGPVKQLREQKKIWRGRQGEGVRLMNMKEVDVHQELEVKETVGRLKVLIPT